MDNAFCHLELNTDNVAKAKAYYAQVFTWKLEDVPMGPGGSYTMINTGGSPGGGMQKKPMPQAPNMWLMYIAVDKLEDTIAASVKAGGITVQPPMPIPDMGRMAILQDPTGAVFGIWEPAQK